MYFHEHGIFVLVHLFALKTFSKTKRAKYLLIEMQIKPMLVFML